MRSRVILERPSGETLAIDSWVSGNFERTSRISDHPIEQGALISDHAQADPLVITLSLQQSEAPLAEEGLEGPFGAERIQEAIRFFEAAWRGSEPLTVTIPRVGQFDDLLIARVPNELNVRQATTIELVLRQIEIASAIIVSVPIEAIAPPSRAGQQAAEDRGKQPTDDVPEDPETPGEATGVPDSAILQLKRQATELAGRVFGG